MSPTGLSEFMSVSDVAAVGDDVLFRAEKEKQQVKIEVEQLKEQLENVGKAKVRNFAQSRLYLIFTARCTLVQSAVLRLHDVRLSVCL